MNFGEIREIIVFFTQILKIPIVVDLLTNIFGFIAILGIIYLIFLSVVPMWVVRNFVEKIRAGSFKFEPLQITYSAVIESFPKDYRDWLDRNKFEYYGSFQYENVSCNLWQQRINQPQQRFFVWMNNVTYNFATSLTSEFSLTTATHDTTFFLPHPHGDFVQSLLDKPIEEVWEFHLEGESFLIDEYCLELNPIVGKVEEQIVASTIKQGKHISQIPFYWLRAPYWYYFKRFQPIGIPISTQLRTPK